MRPSRLRPPARVRRATTTRAPAGRLALTRGNPLLTCSQAAIPLATPGTTGSSRRLRPAPRPERRCARARGDAQEARKVDALGHDLKHVDAVAATCTEAGTAEHWVCSRCGALFSDADATKTVAAEDLAIEPTGHRFENGTCTVCGAKDPDYVTPTQPNKDEEPEIPATGDPASLAPALFGAGAALAGAVTVWRRRSSRHAA